MTEKYPINILFLEDEPLIAEDMIRKLQKRVTEVKHVSSLNEARVFFKNKETCDLLVLDIQLSDGTSFQLFDEFEIHQPVIFATAYDEYAIRAFRVNSIDYLLKPVDEDQLDRALLKFQARQVNQVSDIKTLLSLIKNNNAPLHRERFLVQVRNSQHVLRVSEVACFVRDQLIYAFTHTGEKYILDYESLDLLEEELNPDLFFRTNRQSIVALSAIEKFRTDSAGKLFVKLEKGYSEEIDVSREKARSFKNWLER